MGLRWTLRGSRWVQPSRLWGICAASAASNRTSTPSSTPVAGRADGLLYRVVAVQGALRDVRVVEASCAQHVWRRCAAMRRCGCGAC